MTGQEIITAISTVGFPIVMCLIMMWYIKSQNETHSAEMNLIGDEIKALTIQLQRLVDKVGE